MRPAKICSNNKNTLVTFQVLDCYDIDSDDPVKHSKETLFIPEHFEIV